MTLTTLYLLKWNEYGCVNTLTTVQFMRVYQVAAHEIYRKFLLTKDMWISFCKHSIEPETMRINNAQVKRVSQFKLLGVWQQNNLRWNYHVEQTIKKACKRLYHLRECRKARLPMEVGITVYCTKIRPLLEYALQVWGGLPQYLADDLQSIQNRCLDIISISRATLPTLEQRRMEATKRELERTIEDINHPNQVFFSKSSTSYNLYDLNLVQLSYQGLELKDMQTLL